MKKLLILAGVLALTMSTQVFAADTAAVTNKEVGPAQKQICPCAPKKVHKPKFDKESFEKRLKLTDEQKEQARLIRQKGHEQMKPIMEKMKEKRQEIEAVKRSRMAVQMQQEKIAELQKEIGALKREAHELRMQNMKNFESILTKKQLKELKKMKEEGRKNFEKRHKRGGHPGPRPGFGPEGPAPIDVAPADEAK